LKCPAGFYTSFDESSNCTACPIHQISEIGSRNCSTCPLGTFAEKEGSFECTFCAPGKELLYSGDSKRTCIPCRENTYSGFNFSACIPCPDGSSSNLLGANDSKLCVPCEIGKYMNYNGSDRFCDMCSKNYYSEKEGQDICFPCPIGKQTLEEGSWTCIPCPTGTWSVFVGSDCNFIAPLSQISADYFMIYGSFFAFAFSAFHVLKRKNRKSEIRLNAFIFLSALDFYIDIVFIAIEPLYFEILRYMHIGLLSFAPIIFVFQIQLKKSEIFQSFAMSYKKACAEYSFTKFTGKSKNNLNYLRASLLIGHFLFYQLLSFVFFTMIALYLLISKAHILLSSSFILLLRIFDLNFFQKILERALKISLFEEKSIKRFMHSLFLHEAFFRVLPLLVLYTVNIIYLRKSTFFAIMKITLSSLIFIAILLSSRKSNYADPTIQTVKETFVSSSADQNTVKAVASEVPTITQAQFHKEFTSVITEEKFTNNDLFQENDLKNLLDEIRIWLKNSMIKKEEAFQMAMAIEVLGYNEQNEFALSYFSFKAQSNLCDNEAIQKFKTLMKDQIRKHMNQIKIHLLHTLDDLMENNYLKAEECNIIQEKVEKANQEELFTNLCFYEASYELLDNSEEIAEEIKSIFFMNCNLDHQPTKDENSRVYFQSPLNITASENLAPVETKPFSQMLDCNSLANEQVMIQGEESILVSKTTDSAVPQNENEMPLKKVLIGEFEILVSKTTDSAVSQIENEMPLKKVLIGEFEMKGEKKNFRGMARKGSKEGNVKELLKLFSA
jgi:hypothetical protein